MKLIVACLLVATALTLAASVVWPSNPTVPSPHAPEKPLTFSKPTMGCRSKDVMSRMVDIRDDQQAVKALYQRSDCIIVPLRTPLKIEEWDWHFVCIRPEGLPDCYWVFSG